ncbi:MAG: DUF4326 domain-containing protein [Deltaproteobacteria bacterium]|nr:MAG: DUF4326 domain-containing protein [Deltaproteobacteria bacterium]
MARVIHIRDRRGTPDEVYIGRAGHGHDGYFGNPIRVGQVCQECGSIHQDRGDTIPCYESYVRSRMECDPMFRSKVKGLRGKTLVCFCKPNPCHGDILAKIAEE